jgi:hypothetical protein
VQGGSALRCLMWALWPLQCPQKFCDKQKVLAVFVRRVTGNTNCIDSILYRSFIVVCLSRCPVVYISLNKTEFRVEANFGRIQDDIMTRLIVHSDDQRTSVNSFRKEFGVGETHAQPPSRKTHPNYEYTLGIFHLSIHG